MFHQNLGKKFQDGGQTSAQRPLGVLAVSRRAAKRQFFRGLVPNTAYRRAFSTCSAHKLCSGVSWSHIGCSSGAQLEHDWRRKYRTWRSWRVPKVSFTFAGFFVCRGLFENRKPYDFSLTSRFVCIFIPALCPRLTDKNQCSFRAHLKKRFSLGLYSHLRKEQTHNELQKKLDCDEKIKAMQAQLHRTEERIRPKKRRLISLITGVARCMFKVQLVSGFNAWKLSSKLYLFSTHRPHFLSHLPTSNYSCTLYMHKHSITVLN